MLLTGFIRWFTSIFINAVALIFVAQLFDTFYLENFGTALLASVILSLFNLVVRPILIIFTLPATVLTLGLFLFVINAITLMLTQAVMDDSFIINGFGTALGAAVIIAIINVILDKIIRN